MSNPSTNGNASQNGPTNPAATINLTNGFQLTTGSHVQNLTPAPPIADVMAQLEDYTPTIPDSVTMHFLNNAGFESDDPRIVKLVSLAAQKFVSDIANDALQHCKLRGAGQVSKKSKDRKYTMTPEDLSLALSDQGISLKKPPYYV